MVDTMPKSFVHHLDYNMKEYKQWFKLKLEKSNNAVIDVLLNCVQLYDSPVLLLA